MFSLCLFVVAVGFTMSEAVVSRSRECGHVIRRSFSGIITSHYDFPVGPYPNSYRCLWRIQAPPLYRIKMFTPRMSVEYEPECDFDHLDVYDDVNTSNSSRRLARLCGRERSNYIISSGPYLTLDWTSDSTVAKMGFLIRYEFVPSSSPLVRGGMQRRERYRCSSSDIRCEDGFCVPAKYHCDGINDCSNKADEQGCPTLYPPTTRPTTTRPPTTTKASTTQPPTTTPASGATQSPPSGRSCGVTPIQPDLSEGRVVGGKVAVPGSWPWTISLRLNGGHTCGGSIISPRWVMTAAHCVEGYKNSNQWTIVAGLHAETNLNSKTKTIRVQRIIVHPQWNSQATDYDYTLLYLAQPLSYTNEIQPICLASRILGADVGCFVAGWGATKGTGGQGFLKQAFVKTFNHADCQSFYGGVTNRMICAGHREGGRDTCQGDSGGPLMCKIGSNWELHGATSFGGACAAPNSPGVYSRISKITDWARQTMRS